MNDELSLPESVLETVILANAHVHCLSDGGLQTVYVIYRDTYGIVYCLEDVPKVDTTLPDLTFADRFVCSDKRKKRQKKRPVQILYRLLYEAKVLPP
ncbi:hypothetical protein GOP47_0010499 [Adiantum capillus-veneris]|uniref:Uncharacterized protein n=1 Tax=Adiantum capillus-veneris TaxID=13818 RepID=A0A9D4UVZ1_ADICA|nr:hypothetical protein GOP47_0010499 [Adiantum capillus-veneris]